MQLKFTEGTFKNRNHQKSRQKTFRARPYARIFQNNEKITFVSSAYSPPLFLTSFFILLSQMLKNRVNRHGVLRDGAYIILVCICVLPREPLRSKRVSRSLPRIILSQTTAGISKLSAADTVLQLR